MVSGREILCYNKLGACLDNNMAQGKKLLIHSDANLKENASVWTLNENSYSRSTKGSPSPCPSKADSDHSISSGKSHSSDECLLCLDGFTEDDVKMQAVNTICACGVNKIKIHRQCLDVYKRKYNECPYCKEYFYF